MQDSLKIAVLIPCYNEEKTIGLVIKSFQECLPEAKIYVYDNCSTDLTTNIAGQSGAIVFYEPNKGKGNVVRRMFSDIEADLYIMVDGDATYDASVVRSMLDKLISEKLDMVVAVRKATSNEAYRGGHVFGNKMITGLVSLMFKRGFTDMLSGYRVMTRRFVKSFPISSSGFEIETEITIHTLQLQVPFGEIDSKYEARPDGSQSKLSTWSDGFKILKMIVFLLKEQKPFYFFGVFFLFFFLVSIWLATPVILTWVNTGLVPRLPTALLTTGLMILAFLSLTAGIVLDSVSRARLEGKRLKYLSISLTD
jgi:glycosyltransferase involved in cell wall biosynthesis